MCLGRNCIHLVLVASFIAGCTSDIDAPLIASDISMSEAVTDSGMSAAYLKLTNSSNAVISLTSVSSPQFAIVEMHETKIEDNIARMRRIDSIDIQPGATITFERGGKHLMLMQPQESAESVTLNFFADDLLMLSVSTAIDGR